MARLIEPAVLPPEEPPASDAFWRRFVAERWDREPMLLRRPLSPPLVTAEELFATFRGAVKAKADRGKGARLRFHLGHARVVAGASRFWPTESDRDVSAYLRRLREAHGAPICATLNAAQEFDATLWRRTLNLFSGFFRAHGRPTSLLDAIIFIGDYGVTPAGAHRDPVGSFLYGVVGEKRVLLWERETWDALVDRDRENHLDFDALLPQALELRVGPQDLAYWPPRFHHVVLAEEPTASLNFGMGCNPDHSTAAGASVLDVAWDLLRAEGAHRRPAAVPQPPSLLPDDGLPEHLEGQLAALRTALDEGRLADGLMDEWMREASRGSMTGPPPLHEGNPIQEEDVVQGDPSNPVLSRTTADRAVLASGGRLIRLSGGEVLPLMIDRLNRGEPIRVADLLDTVAGADLETRATLLEILDLLRRMHGIQVQSRSSS